MSETRAMGRRSLALVGLVAALVAVGPAAADDPADEKAAVDARIAALQAEIAQANSQEGVLTSQLSAVVAELEDAQAAVDSAEASVSALETELSSEQARLKQLTALLAKQTKRLQRLQAEYLRAVAILEARVRSAYIDEPPDLLAFLVSASSFDDLIDNVDFLERVGAQDQRVARQVERARTRAAAERRATIGTRRLQAAAVSVIAARTDDARAARDRLADDRDRLSTVESLKRSSLASTRETREEFVSEVESLAAESADLAAQIKAAQDGAGSNGTGQPSAAGLIWPCDGVVTSGFGMRWGRMHEGIDIGCAVWLAESRRGRRHRHLRRIAGRVRQSRGRRSWERPLDRVRTRVGDPRQRRAKGVAGRDRLARWAQRATRPGRTCTSKFASTASPLTRCCTSSAETESASADLRRAKRARRSRGRSNG